MTYLSIWKGEIALRHRMADIASRIAEESRTDLATLRGPSQRRIHSAPRLQAFSEIWETGRFSLTQIGHYFGERDRTTVHKGIRRYRAAISCGASVDRTGLGRPSSRKSG